MDHTFLWDTLKTGGIPHQFIAAIQSLYKNNWHHTRVNGQLYEGPVVHSGVRQGCPLSGFLFAICVDVLLLRLQDLLTCDNEIARAFADDVATAIQDYKVSIPAIAHLFHEFEQISRLQLNIAKTVFIPLWPIGNERHLKNLITELCPSWRNISVAPLGKYFGFMIGPGAKDNSWSKALVKYDCRVRQWRGAKCGLLWNTLYYNTFAIPTLEFIAQLETIPESVISAETQALRRFASGPGNWISHEDLEHSGTFGIGSGFNLLAPTAKAAKLRLLHSVGKKYVSQQLEQISSAHSESGRRPFKGWHDASFAKVLHDNANALRGLGIHEESISAAGNDVKVNSFQKHAMQLVVRHLVPY